MVVVVVMMMMVEMAGLKLSNLLNLEHSDVHRLKLVPEYWFFNRMLPEISSVRLSNA